VTEKSKAGAFYGDVIAAPEDKIAELVDGALYLSPRPSPRHANASSVLGAILNSAFQRAIGGPGGWWILDEPELHFDGDVLVPDLAGWRKERLAELPDSAGMTLRPDWVCEVLSPSTERFDRAEKLPRYAREGVAYLWLVDPRRYQLEVYALFEARWNLLEMYAADAIAAATPFEAVPFELNGLWGR
jgi:Uma2 family endonuclease